MLLPELPNRVDPDTIHSNPAPAIISAVPDDTEVRAYMGLLTSLGWYHIVFKLFVEGDDNSGRIHPGGEKDHDSPDLPDPVDLDSIYRNPVPGIISPVPDDVEERTYLGLLASLGWYNTRCCVKISSRH